MDEKVGTHMSTPPIVARPSMKTGEAAALMLARKIHRLPVVDEQGCFIGCVAGWVWMGGCGWSGVGAAWHAWEAGRSGDCAGRCGCGRAERVRARRYPLVPGHTLCATHPEPCPAPPPRSIVSRTDVFQRALAMKKEFYA